MARNEFSLSDIRFVKRITIGNINPNSTLTDERNITETKLLNKCLDEGKGKIIGKDVNYGVYQIGEHQVTLQSTTYHVGFKRKPYWLNEEGENI